MPNLMDRCRLLNKCLGDCMVTSNKPTSFRLRSASHGRFAQEPPQAQRPRRRQDFPPCWPSYPPRQPVAEPGSLAFFPVGIAAPVEIDYRCVEVWGCGGRNLWMRGWEHCKLPHGSRRILHSDEDLRPLVQGVREWFSICFGSGCVHLKVQARSLWKHKVNGASTNADEQRQNVAVIAFLPNLGRSSLCGANKTWVILVVASPVGPRPGKYAVTTYVDVSTHAGMASGGGMEPA
jgi:hypothetical protein